MSWSGVSRAMPSPEHRGRVGRATGRSSLCRLIIYLRVYQWHEATIIAETAFIVLRNMGKHGLLVPSVESSAGHSQHMLPTNRSLES